MAKYAVGDVLVLPFPYSDGSGVKRRPALVVAELPYFGGMDYLVCLITSRNTGDPHSLTLLPSELIGGKLALTSYLRPLYLFAADETLVVRKIGTLPPEKLALVKSTITRVVNL